MVTPYIFTIIVASQIRRLQESSRFSIIDVLVVIALFWFSFLQNDNKCSEPGGAMYAVEMQEKDIRKALHDVLKLCQYAFIIYSKLCVDLS